MTETATSGMRADAEAVVAALALDHDMLSVRDAVTVIRDARRSGTDPLVELRTRNLVEIPALLDIIAGELGMEFTDLFSPGRPYNPDPKVLERCNREWLERLRAIPLVDAADKVVVASAVPTDPALDDYLAAVFTEGYRLVLADGEQVRQLLATEAADAAVDDTGPDDEEDAADIATPGTTVRNPVLDWLDATLVSATTQGTSDLHFELGYDRRLLVRYRSDGDLVTQPMPLVGREMEVIGALMNRAGMDTANQREPQDGSFAFTTGGRRVDVRAAMIPLDTGPKLVLRLLDPNNLRSLGELGFGPEASGLIGRALSLTQGLVVVTGPTGSGKTTTLYGMVMELAGPGRNILTVEQPIEYRIPFVSQVPVRSDLGERSVTFDRALRTILRLDPDVILIGEVRDAVSAKVALEAALTGHLVLTTIHAPSALGVFTRFIEMGGPPYLVSEAMTLSISQRLVKRLHTCRRLLAPTDAQREALAEMGYTAPEVVGEPTGCPGCANKGYRGRVAVAELVAPSRRIRSAVALRQPLEEIEKLAVADDDYVPMRSDGQRLLDAGEASVTEIIKASSNAEL
jgi:type IV pilus assembly protein PilB